MRRIVAPTALALLVVFALFVEDIDERRVANMFLIAIAVLAWIFTLLYAFRSRWRQFLAGRSLLYLSLTLALFSTQVTISAWYGSDYPFRNEIRLLLYASLSLTLVNMIMTVWSYQRRGALDEREPGGKL